MPRTERIAEAHGKNPNEGTSARTRPFSFEDIMLRRRKKFAADPKGGTELRALSEKVDANGDRGRPDSDWCDKRTKILKDVDKVSSKKTEGKDKGNKANTKVKSSHGKSGRDKESKNEKLSYHKSSTSVRLGADSEREREKKRLKDAVGKDKHEDRNRKSKKEKRKHPSHIDEKSRSEFDGSYSKKHDSGKLRDTEYSERGDRKKEYSQPYNDERRSKRRRSRSPDYHRERDRSVSVSPRAQKQFYHGRDYGDSSFQSYREKSRRNYLDTEKDIPDTGGYASGHHRKHRSGLGGYSPRKRKTEAAVKTPSPTTRSPERKSATWDQPPTGTSNAGSGSMLVNLQSPATKKHELESSVSVTPATTIPQPVPTIDNVPIVLNASIDSVQLTQVTRPLRRLYIENLPQLASDKTVIDCFNDFLMLPGVNYIQRTKPCISCIINKEKSQAVVEFLTPEDATKTLSFDGKSLSGSVLKIRRPKDFIESATGVPDKPIAVTEAISDVVKDTPHKIFVGGISKALSSDMFVEILSAFGLLKAYHFEFNEDLNGSIAFLEYADHSITSRACAGLNGMKLGGHVLTAVQAIPNDNGEEESTDAVVSYIIPKHAKSLLAEPTQVLQLKNVFDRDEFLLLSEAELEEALEDIRLECARFGIVKSVNIARFDNITETAPEAIEHDPIGEEASMMEVGEESASVDMKQNGGLPSSNDVKMLQNVDNEVAVDHLHEEEPANPVLVSEEPLNHSDASGDSPSLFDKDGGDTSAAESCLYSEADTKQAKDGGSSSGALDKAEASGGDGERMGDEITDLNTSAADEAGASNGDEDHQTRDLTVFEPGCVFVEFSRAEAACTGAHCLHGRSYGERIVMVGYVQRDLYVSQFPR